MALKVVNATPQPKLKVGNNYGMQYSPNVIQQPKPTSQVLQNTRNPQPVTYNPQKTAPAKKIQPAATAEQIQAAAEAQRRAVEAEVARQKKILKDKFNSNVESKIRSNMTKLTVEATKTLPRLKFGKTMNPQIKLPEQSEYDKAYAEAWHEAMAEFDKQRAGEKKSGFSKFWDKVTFGQDDRENDARRFAERRAKEIMDRDFPEFEKRITKYESMRATAQDEIIKAANTFKSQSEYDAFVAKKQSELDSEYNTLVKLEARYSAQTAAFGKASQMALTSKTARGLSKVKKLASDENPIWKYTLGSGTENIPSIVTAPSRVVNFVGNLNTKDREIYQYGGGSVKRTETGKNAWQSGFNQRNFNVRPWVDKTKDNAPQWLKDEVKSLIKARKDIGVTDPDKLDYDKVFESRLNSWNSLQKRRNTGLELAADPLNLLLGAGAASKGAKGTSWGSKLLNKVDDVTKYGKFKKGVGNFVENNKTLKWLNKEATTPSEEFALRKNAIQAGSRGEQERLLAHVEKLTKKMKDVPGYDLSWYDEFKKLGDSDLRIIQRMTGDGKLAFRDRVMLAGRNYAPVRKHLEDLGRRYSDFMEKLKLVDDVKSTRFGFGKNRIYSPRTRWVEDLEDYNFKAFKRGRQVQSGDDFLHGIGDRFFKSDIDDVIIANTKHNKKWQSHLKSTWDEYGKTFEKAKGDMEVATRDYRKRSTGLFRWARNKRNVREDVTFGRAVVNSANKLAHAPTRLWKQSVLKYRPAWTVNNVMYNTQANALAAGGRGLIEQAKMLNPRYFRKAMDEGAMFRSNLGKEIGTGRLSKFYSGVEDWSRVAAGRALEKKGFSTAQAQKRVNNYLFDYTTKNWERPLKTVVPFWSFQKNVAKAAARMPFDRPLAAIGYNRLDRYQQMQYDADFDKVVPELEKLGYSEEEIEKFRAENAKYFRGRLKVGDKYITTPFNVFSDKQMAQFGINPWLSAAQEAADAEDSFGRKVSGEEASFMRRILSKFPQFEIGRKAKQKFDIDAGRLKPSEKYIGEPGSEGFGMGKEKQGYDPSKPNYVPSMDPRQKLGQDLLAFAGVPRGLEFDKTKFVHGKKLQKVTSEYFATDWKSMDFEAQQAGQKALFEKYGMTADDFYKGILAKYDTENTKFIKGLKEDAKNKNQALFDEYEKQPYGTKSAWAAKKMQELQEAGYFKDNPYLYSFVSGTKKGDQKRWINPTTLAKAKTGAQKKADYDYAIRTGDWSAWRKKYGIKSEKARLVQEALSSGDWSKYRAKYGDKPTEKKLAYDRAKATGDWTDYRTKYGVKNSPHQFEGKFFKTAESMKKYKDAQFWKKYGDLDREGRRKLLADNPEYNTRANWTQEQWDEWKENQKKIELAKASGFKNFSKLLQFHRGQNTFKANQFNAKRRFEKRGVAIRIS